MLINDGKQIYLFNFIYRSVSLTLETLHNTYSTIDTVLFNTSIMNNQTKQLVRGYNSTGLLIQVAQIQFDCCNH